MEDNDVKTTCGGIRSIVQNLARYKKVDSKSDTLWKFEFKIWQDGKTLFQNYAFYKNIFFQNHAS